MSQDVVADHNVGQAEFKADLRYDVEAKETFESRDTAAAGFGRNVVCGFHAEHRNSMLLKKPQQIAVVAGDFQDLAGVAKIETVDIRCGHRLHVFDETVGVGRKVSVFSE
jgi:hypothetical protein